MNIGRLFRTVRHLKTIQLFYQVRNRLFNHKFRLFSAPIHKDLKFYVEPIPRYRCLEGDVFTFLNLGHFFIDWNFAGYGPLWTYNLNYFDYINQIGITQEDGCHWIDRFIENRPNITWGLDPYPIALRGINWIKFFCKYPEVATKKREDSLYSQYKLLEKKLEYHLLGNHLMEDAYSLFIGSLYFEDKAIYEKASKLLKEQLEEQVLMDGAHYEQSPMYHCILLDRLLDCINLGLGSRGERRESRVESRESRVKGQVARVEGDVEVLIDFAQRMLGHLESIVWSDKTIPLLNDSANGIAPTAEQIFDYAKRLGLEWNAIPMKECGYRKMSNTRMEAIVDVGNITATYQPGHTHTDTFNYELRIDGKPFVVDTGVSTYNKNERRQYERSTAAHNCVCAVDGVKMLDSSEVWGGFRVGRRASVRVLHESTRINNEEQTIDTRDISTNHTNLHVSDDNTRNTRDTWRQIIQAEHDGFGKPCSRSFTMTDDAFIIEDSFDGEAVSLIHLAPGVEVESQETGVESRESSDRSQESSVKSQEGNGCLIKTNMSNILIEGAERVEIVDEKASTEYNRFEPIKVLKVYFKNNLKYTIC